MALAPGGRKRDEYFTKMIFPQVSRSKEEQVVPKINSSEEYLPEKDVACQVKDACDNEECGDACPDYDFIIGRDETGKEKIFPILMSAILKKTPYSTMNVMVLEPCGIIAVKKVERRFIDTAVIMEPYDLEYMLQDVEHPNIVKFYVSHSCEHRSLVCMEFMEISISGILEKCYGNMEEDIEEFIPENFIWYIVKPILLALSHIYFELNCHHGDLNTTEVLLNRHGVVKLTAFNGTPIHPKHKILINKLDTYIAPERFHDELGKGLNIRSDIWSLGVILYKLATGKVPFPNPRECEGLEALQHYKKNASCPLENRSNEISKDLRSFISKCMEMEITDRPSLNDLMKSCSEVPGYNAAEFIEKYIQEFLKIDERRIAW